MYALVQGLTINLISPLYTICIHRSLLGNQGYDLIKSSSLYLGCDGNSLRVGPMSMSPSPGGSWCVSRTQGDIVWISTDKQHLQGFTVTKTQLLNKVSENINLKFNLLVYLSGKVKRSCQAPTQLPTPSPIQPNLISTQSQSNSSKS